MEFAAVEGNLRESFRVLARHNRGGEIREYDGVSVASSGVSFQMFNAAFLSSPLKDEADLRRRLAQCSIHFRMRGLGWAFWLCEGWVPGAMRRRVRQVFRDHHMQLAVELPGMVSDCLPAARNGVPRLDIRRVSAGAISNDFCAIGSLCFGVPLPWFREVFGSDAVWNEFASWVGYADGEPVCTAAAVAGADAIGLYNIATVPGRQRRGYGEAVMRHAVMEACREHRIDRTILQATSQGYRLYQRVGFRTVTKVTVWAS